MGESFQRKVDTWHNYKLKSRLSSQNVYQGEGKEYVKHMKVLYGGPFTYPG